VVFTRAQALALERERDTDWVRALAGKELQ
jgi:hypothetical protein